MHFTSSFFSEYYLFVVVVILIINICTQWWTIQVSIRISHFYIVCNALEAHPSLDLETTKKELEGTKKELRKHKIYLLEPKIKLPTKLPSMKNVLQEIPTNLSFFKIFRKQIDWSALHFIFCIQQHLFCINIIFIIHIFKFNIIL